MSLTNTTSFEDGVLDQAERLAAVDGNWQRPEELAGAIKSVICVVEALDNRMTALIRRNAQLEIDVQAALDSR
jgi:hypothetical protein